MPLIRVCRELGDMTFGDFDRAAFPASFLGIYHH